MGKRESLSIIYHLDLQNYKPKDMKAICYFFIFSVISFWILSNIAELSMIANIHTHNDIKYYFDPKSH